MATSSYCFIDSPKKTNIFIAPRSSAISCRQMSSKKEPEHQTLHIVYMRDLLALCVSMLTFLILRQLPSHSLTCSRKVSLGCIAETKASAIENAGDSESVVVMALSDLFRPGLLGRWSTLILPKAGRNSS